MSGRDHARDFAVSLPQHPQYRRRRLAVVRWHISLCYASIGMGNNVENALIAVISVLTASTSTITVSAVDASLEFAPDAIRHENRDDEMRYIAYVPPGSIDRGKHIAQAGADSPANACTSCHGAKLREDGLIPPIAGRSPTYILRQLLAFQTSARSGATGLPMRAVVKDLKIRRMIDVAAYAASLPP